ncbi:MAG: tRNA (adenosine(37)-N6)-threonylcarbamoyltransferase complex ATPase subunit type 1 TsaE [Firmicutes bacterium]|nr:tRNA (adenosine(37)-N6)-threonylcarbamoyltransferase complex ATPase subunit type 1 TsaE [Bacillota bacterium]
MEGYLRNLSETGRLGKIIGSVLRVGDLIALTGPLGAGKTTLTRGIAAGTQSLAEVKSPSFTLMRVYPGRITLFHLDVYRLRDASEVEGLAVEEYLQEGAVILEWADKVAAWLPEDGLWVELSPLEKIDERWVHLTARGARGAALLTEVAQRWP